jgi:hypothetical protein
VASTFSDAVKLTNTNANASNAEEGGEGAEGEGEQGVEELLGAAAHLQGDRGARVQNLREVCVCCGVCSWV